MSKKVRLKFRPVLTRKSEKLGMVAQFAMALEMSDKVIVSETRTMVTFTCRKKDKWAASLPLGT